MNTPGSARHELDEHTTVAEYGTHLRLSAGFLDFLRGLGERGAIDEALSAFRKHVETAPLADRASGSRRAPPH
jgi:hypothetical protein